MPGKLHPSLGKLILQTWKFPTEIAQTVAEHQNIDRKSKTLDYTNIVIAASLHSDIGRSPAVTVDGNKVPAMKRFNLDPEMIIEILKEAREEIQAIHKV